MLKLYDSIIILLIIYFLFINTRLFSLRRGKAKKGGHRNLGEKTRKMKVLSNVEKFKFQFEQRSKISYLMCLNISSNKQCNLLM